MKNFNLTILLALSTFLSATASYCEETPTLTLQDCYRLSLKQSEKLAQQKELIKEAEARFNQALSKILPRVSYSYSHKWQDGSGSSNFTLREVPEGKFVVTQPLFGGFKEVSLMKAGRAEKKQREFEEERARETLFADVYETFYLLLSYDEDIATLQKTKDVLNERIAELKKREELGRARASEVMSAEVRLNSLEADIELALSEREIARQLLEFLTGFNVTAVSDDADSSRAEVSVLENYLAQSEKRADVLAAKEAQESLQKQLWAAKGGFSPTVDLEGNYFTERVGNSRDVDWDMTLTVDVPLLFDGQENFEKIREIRAKINQAELGVKETKRKAELDIKNAYTRLLSARKRKEALQKALGAAQENYRLQQEDYRLNLVSNLGVLQALEDLQDIERNFIAANNEARKSFWNLKVATGEIPHDSF